MVICTRRSLFCQRLDRGQEQAKPKARRGSDTVRPNVFVGVGIDHYASATGLTNLEHAVADVKAVASALVPPFAGEPLIDADADAVHKRLRSMNGSAAGGTLVLMWSGHGAELGGLRLATADEFDGVAASEVIRACVLSGASQLLLVIDTCSAAAALESAAMARQLLQQFPTSDVRAWLGILVSCSATDVGARDGAFGPLLVKLLTEGPDSADQQRRWSKHNNQILGEDLGLALLEEWSGVDHRPEFLKDGHPLAMIPNPLYDDGAPEEVVEHLLLAARGGGPGDEQSWFTGRTAEMDEVVAWVRSREAGVRVVTGSAGTGKSAVVGRVVSLSNPHERTRLQSRDENWGHDDPGVRSVAAHVHARGLTVERIAELIEWQLIRAKFLEPFADGRRNAADLLGAVQRAVEGGRATPVVVIDGLDEARGQAFAIAENLLLRLAPFATVVVSTRPVTHQDGSALLDKLAPAAVLDLDSEDCLESARTAIGDYVRKRLTGVDQTMDASMVAAHLAGVALAAADRPFLLARVITDQLRARPVSTVRPEWRDRVAGSTEDAFDADLSRIAPPPGSTLDGPTARHRARTMLIALTWAVGAGFPEQEWLTVASALTETALDRDDVSWVLDQLGRYVVQDGDAGVAVYRLAHQSFADHLRPPYRPTGQHPFNPAALPVSVALMQQYDQLLTDGVSAETPAYLWSYTWVHAASAGFEGLSGLRELARARPELQPDVAMAALQTGNIAAVWGRRNEAVAPAEEAVAIYQALAEEVPAYAPDLANALDNLGISYGEVGRRGEAVSPVLAAVAFYRALAEENPAYLPYLAGSLNNLGIRYKEVGQRSEALPPTEEAVNLYQALADENPVHLPYLASALNNLGIRYSEVGRRGEAVTPTKEAVELYRALTEENPVHLPYLASALNNLGIRYSEVGRRGEALPPTEEAVELYRALTEENPVYLPELASALNNLGVRCVQVGRRGEALPPTKEAVELYRALTEENPVYLPDLAGALSSLGISYNQVGRRSEAVAPAEEAVTLRRALAEENPAYLPDLAGSLKNLGITYSEVGRRDEAVTLTEEAVKLYRALAEENPAYLPSLAGALSSLGIRYNEVGRGDEALFLTEEAVRLYRALAEENPAYLPDLGGVLNNLGINYNEVGRPDEALFLTEEAVELYRALAEQNPAYLPDLAGTLNSLGVRYDQLGQPDKTIASTEEAVTLLRALAEENPAYLPGLASALNNLGISYVQVEQQGDAPIEEAVTIYRALAEQNPAHLHDLANTLNNLAVNYSEAGRHSEAVAPAEEAVTLHRALIEENPVYLSDLAETLENLARQLAAVDRRDEADAVWADALATAGKRNQMALLLYRAAYAQPGDPRSAAWLYAVVTEGGRESMGPARSIARRHRAANPEPWERAWTAVAHSPLPTWLVVDPDMLSVASGWITTENYEDERDYLAAHPEILDDTFDLAMEEAVLAVPESEATRHTELRAAARSIGVMAAYRPVLVALLAQAFAFAETTERQRLLADRKPDLLDDLSLARLTMMAEQTEEDSRPAVALALLHLARAKPDDDLADVFAALDTGQFATLLHAAASELDVNIMRNLAFVALSSARTAADAAEAGFHLSLVAVIEEHNSAPLFLREAIKLAPEKRDAWIARIAELGATRPAVLALIPTLMEPNSDD
ncbi:tetratricopeptide repeat protein [Lentzea sp. JNUCC 0626]|uniref:tetratricopeptide repeat protein n=1 Tax=Lentzea sp. JNUCC 0626 TaxID=3367513 RepID=UPI00374840E5